MSVETNGTSGIPAGRGKMFLALGIMAVLVVAVAAFTVADHPAMNSDDVAGGGDAAVDDTVIADGAVTSTSVEKKFSGNLTINGTTKYYTSFDDAIAEARESGSKEIVFASDATFDKGKDMATDDWGYYDVSELKINLGGHTATIQNRMALILAGTEDYTVCNGKLEVVVQGKYENGNDKYISYSLFIGKETAGETDDSVDVVLKNLQLHGGVNARNTGSVTLDGISYIGENYYSVWAQSDVEVIINSGQYSTTGARVIAAGEEPPDKNGNVKVNGGTFEIQEGKGLYWTGMNFPLEIFGGFFYVKGGDSDFRLKNELNGYLATLIHD